MYDGYLNVISIDDAKIYLRIDDTQNIDDKQIGQFIKGACMLVERYTNHILYARDKVYKMVDGKVRVYDFPINTDVDTLTLVKHYCYTLYTEFVSKGTVNGCCADDLTLNIGYVNADEVPPALIDAIYQIIDQMYYQHQEGKKSTQEISELSYLILDEWKRFIL